MATATAPGNYRPAALRRTVERSDRSEFLARWLKVWVALIAVVVLVVIVYLIFITNNLASINSGLAVARNAVTGIGGNTMTLPGQIHGINGSLGGIDPALKPITGQATQIIDNLTSIENKLRVIAPSLVDTSSVLVGTSGTLGGIAGTLTNVSGSLVGTSSTLNGIAPSLVDTSSVLTSVLGLAGQINGTLVAANIPAGNCASPEIDAVYTPPPNGTPGSFGCNPAQVGVRNIHQRVSIANNVLAPAQSDLVNIVGNLNSSTGVVRQLTDICRASVLQTLGTLQGGVPC